MSRPATELENALRTVTHDVRASAGVLLSALDELSREVPEGGRASDLMRMVRRSARRLEILADATELLRHNDPSLQSKVTVDLAALTRELVPQRMLIERAAPVPTDIAVPHTANVKSVPTWCRYILGEVFGYTMKRAKERFAVKVAVDNGQVIVTASSDATHRAADIGGPFTHTLGLAAELTRSLGGDIRLLADDTLCVEVRLPLG